MTEHCSSIPEPARRNVDLNTDLTDRLRARLQLTLTDGDEPFLARRAGLCTTSVQKQVEGKNRYSADLMRVQLLLLQPEEVAGLLSQWLGIRLAAIEKEPK